MPLGMSPEEQDLQYRIFLDAIEAINQLKTLANTATDFDTRITAASNAAMQLGEKFGISGSAAVKILQQMDVQLAALQAKYDSLAAKSAVFGNYGAQAWRDVGAAVRTAEQDMNAFEHGIDFIRVVLGTLAAMLVFNVIQAITQTFTTAIEMTKKWEIALYNLQNAERLMSESGIDVSLKDLEAVVDRLSVKFKGMFSKTELTDVVGDIAIATKDLGFSVQQIEQLSQAIAGVQLRNPELTLMEAEQHAITALLSGRTQALQSMGIAANEATVKEKALEMGLIKTGEALTPQTKAAAILQIMYDALKGETQDLTERQNTLTGVTQSLTAAWEDALKNLGTAAAPIAIQFLKSLTEWLQYSNKYFDEFKTQIETVSVVLSGFAAVVAAVNARGGFGSLGGMIELATNGMKDFNRGVSESLSYFRQLNSSADTATASLKDAGAALQDLSKLNVDSLTQSVSSFADRAAQLAENLQNQQSDSLNSYLTNLARSQQDYQISVANTVQEYNNKRKDIEQKYRNNELDAEAKFQEKMRQLREKYLFDLEDALRNRDARQVLRLMAQYQMQSTAAQNEYNLEHSQKQKQYQQDLQDAKQQEQQKLQQMAQAQALKEQRMAEDYQTERAKQQRQYDQQLADLKQSWDDRLLQEAQKLGEQYGLNDTQVQQLYQLLKSYYGPSGYFDKLYDYSYSSLLARAKALIAAIGGIINSVSSAVVTNSVGGQNTAVGSHTTRRASGGIDIVSSPTTTGYGVTYGEAGPEAHIFIPLGGSGLSSAPSLSSIGGGGAGGHATIEVVLSPDLEARITENTLNQSADIVTRVMRSKR